jgi:hypothetical protein
LGRPCVCAGIGGAYVTMASYQMPPGTGTVAPNYSRWNLAWFCIQSSILVTDILSGPPGNQLTLDSLTGDEVRIGIRYLLN